MSADYRKLIPTLCHECVIDVTGYIGKEPRDSEVFVSLISSHDNHLNWIGWRSRAGRAWSALRGKEPWPWLDFMTPQDLEAFITALSEAHAAVYRKVSDEAR